MIIQRIEHKVTRHGCYRSEPARAIVSEHDWIAFPGPISDKKLSPFWQNIENATGWLFGFGDDQQFSFWVDYGRDTTEGLRRLAINGYVRAYYDAADYFIGDCQAVFQTRTAIRLREAHLIPDYQPIPFLTEKEMSGNFFQLRSE